MQPLNPYLEKDEVEFNEHVNNQQEQVIGGDKLIETSFILPIASLKDFPPLPSCLDMSLKESYTTANNGQNMEESKQLLSPDKSDKMELTKVDKQMDELSLASPGTQPVLNEKSNHKSDDMMQDSMVNVMEQSSFKLATNTNEIEVTNLTPGKENAPLNKHSVDL